MSAPQLNNLALFGFEFRNKVLTLLKRNVKRATWNKHLNCFGPAFVSDDNPSLSVGEVDLLCVNKRHALSPSGKIADATRCFAAVCGETLNSDLTRVSFAGSGAV